MFLISLFACNDMSLQGTSEMGFEDSSGVAITGGGAQDFGKFKEILEDGGVPGPDTIDDVGFFAEHSIELPDPNCGDDSVCLHSQIGHMGNMINGSDCTVLQMGMNAPAELVDWERPPLNLVVAIDVSGSMKGDNMNALKDGLNLMLPELHPEDTVSFVTFNKHAESPLVAAPGDSPDIEQAIEDLTPGGGTNIYEGLRTAYDVALDWDTEDNNTRILLVSDGVATDQVGELDTFDRLDRQR